MSEITGVHPYADRFPMLPEDELQRLAEDIRENGQRSPIMVSLDGLILDGRNRLAACKMLGIDPDFEVCGFEDVAAYVLSANVARRHQSTGSRAMSTALVLADDGRRENGRWKRGSVANTESGNSGQTWRNLLNMAGTILDHAPELAAAVVAGELALDAAHREAEQRRDTERRKLEEEERLAAEEAEAHAFILDHAPDLAARVDGKDLLTYVEARDIWARRNREEAAQIMNTAVERTGPIGTLILITDDEMRDILTHIAGAGDRVLFDRLHDRWTSLRYGTRSGPEVPARGRVVSARHTTLRIPL